MAWDINCDMGEAFGLYKMGDDEGIMPFITAARARTRESSPSSSPEDIQPATCDHMRLSFD